jgi:hypothetical protein
MIHVNRDARLGCGSGGGPDVRGGWVALESVAIDAFTVGTFSSFVHGPRRVRVLHLDLSSHAFCSSLQPAFGTEMVPRPFAVSTATRSGKARRMCRTEPSSASCCAACASSQSMKESSSGPGERGLEIVSSITVRAPARAATIAKSERFLQCQRCRNRNAAPRDAGLQGTHKN